MYENFSFSTQASPIDYAKVGTISTPHGDLPTPNFIFCATKASIKGVATHQVADIGADIILANTYHLMLNPGSTHIANRGGLHKFMNWNKPMLTDSGGYQIFAMGHGSVSAEIKKGSGRSLPKSLIDINEEGVIFKSYLNGSKIKLTPELAITIQQELGADLLMQFDECTPFHVDESYTKNSMQRSIRWGERCLTQFKTTPSNQAIYGIVQGGIYEGLRKESIQAITEQEFWGNAIGGSLGKDKAQMYDVIAFTSTNLDSSRATHLLGIGDIPDIFWGVRHGVDTFDCVHPTRIARHAHAIVPGAIHPSRKLNIKNTCYATDDAPIDENCTQYCCSQYSRSYIHHLFKAKELLGMHLLTIHNIGQITRLMKEIRAALMDTIQFNALEKYWIG